MLSAVVFVIELVATVAFACSGALTGVAKKMDVFGISVLALTTATAGGVIRDLILGLTPPAMFKRPVYAAVAIVTGIIVFIPMVRNLFAKSQRVFDVCLFVTDTLGLAIFTVVGVSTAVSAGQGNNIFLTAFVGVITAVGGGLLKDILAGNTPYIFVKHIYACASLAGALACALLWKVIPQTAAMICGAAVVTVIRFLAATYKWNFPRVK